MYIYTLIYVLSFIYIYIYIVARIRRKKGKKKELLHGRYTLGEKRRVSFLKIF